MRPLSKVFFSGEGQRHGPEDTLRPLAPLNAEAAIPAWGRTGDLEGSKGLMAGLRLKGVPSGGGEFRFVGRD